MAKKPPSPGLVPSTGDVESSQGADESSEVALADDSPDPHRSSPTPSAEESHSPQWSSGSTEVAHLEDSPDPLRSSLPRGAEKSKSPQQAGEEHIVLQRRGYRHASEPMEEFEKRVKRAPIITREGKPEDPYCMPGRNVFWVEEDNEGNLVQVPLDKCMYSNCLIICNCLVAHLTLF